MIQINVRNQSTVMSDAEIKAIMVALQIQDYRDLAPAWGLMQAKLVFAPKDGPEVIGQWELVVLDNSDQAGALGYHDVTANGDPLGKVFAKDDLSSGSSVSVTMSHEETEMRVDPGINLCSSNGTSFYALEVGDPCEDDSFGYMIGGIKVSDFVTPHWFSDFYDKFAKYDFLDHIKAPLQLLANGYISINNGNGWNQITAQITKPEMRAKILEPTMGHRRERRVRGARNFVRSVRPSIGRLSS